MSMLKRQWGRRKKQIAICWISILVAYLSGFLIDIALCAETEENGVVPLATLFALFMLIIVRLIAGSMDVTLEFHLAVSMSTTRKRFVQEYVSLAFLEMVCYYVALCFMFKLEGIICKRAFGLGLAPEVTTNQFAFYLYTALGFLGLIVLELFVGALIMRFSMKIFWVFWAIFMLVSFGNFTNVCFFESLQRSKGFVEFFTMIGRPGICGVILGAELLVFIFAYRLLKRQQIA